MRLILTKEALRAMFPKAPQAVLDAFVAKQNVLDAAGITETRARLTMAMAQVKHETAGFTIKNLTENINYSATRACAVWPSRFKNAADCYSKVGSFAGDPEFPRKLMNSVYGGRMGNRPGTDDGSHFIGRGGPQVTGRDGYREVGLRANLPLVDIPDLAAQPDKQPEVLAAFWTWKGLNEVTEKGLKAVTKIWNGGYIGLESREAAFKEIAKIVAGLAFEDDKPQVTTEGNPKPAAPTPVPPAAEVPAKNPLTRLWERFKALFA
jgi:putative chitinase